MKEVEGSVKRARRISVRGEAPSIYNLSSRDHIGTLGAPFTNSPDNQAVMLCAPGLKVVS